MKKLLAGAAFALTIALSTAAMAAPGWSTGALNLHAGPGKNYPVVAKVAPKAALNVEGCLQNGSWCSVSARGVYGWTSAKHIQIASHKRHVAVLSVAAAERPPVIVFDTNTYWDAHYKAQPFYGSRAQYGYHDVAVHSMGRSRVPRMIDDRIYAK